MTEHESLRTKKARLTRTALHEAAVTRVLDEGLDSATVANIAADVGVSTRTFFNYYQTKEDAIVGLDESSIDEQLVTAYIEADAGIDTLAEDTANFVREALFVGTDPSLSNRRRQLFTAYPDLMTKKFERVEAIEELVAGHVLSRLRFLGQEFSSEDSAWRSARMLTQLCMVPLHHASRVVKRSPDLVAEAGSTKDIYDDSLALFLKVLDRLR